MLESLPNNQAGFKWKVFSIGRNRKIEVDCSMNIKRVPVESTTTTTEMTTAEKITTALTTVQTTTPTEEFTITEQIITTQALIDN